MLQVNAPRGQRRPLERPVLHREDHLTAPRVDRLGDRGQQLVLLAPAGFVLPPDGGVFGKASDQREQSPASRSRDLDAEVEVIEPLEIGLDERPAGGQELGEAPDSPSVNP